MCATKSRISSIAPRPSIARADSRRKTRAAPPASRSATRPWRASKCAATAGRTSSSTFFADLRHGARQLRRAPGFTAVTVFTLALGIGATTTIFSAVNPILFRALPYPHAERILSIYDAGDGGAHRMGTFATYTELAARNHTLDAIAVMKPWQPTLTGSGEPERLEGQRVSASYFRVLGIAPAIGPGPRAHPTTGSTAPPSSLLSDELWRRRFNADPAIVGRIVSLDDNAFTVIGVMPRGFANVPSPGAALWAPLQYDMTQPRRVGAPSAHDRPPARERDRRARAR